MKTMLMPHPVLLPNGSDYRNGRRFDMTVDNTTRTIDDHVVVSLHFELESSFMRRLIAKRRAEYFVVAKCARTYKRETYRTTKSKIRLNLPLAVYADKIILTPYIASTDAIKLFRSVEHHEEFGGVGISLPAGAILARGSDSELTVDQLRTLSAAICFVDDDRLKNGEFEIDVNDDYINIKMHKDTRQKVERLRKGNLNVLYPSIYMSALTHAIQSLEANPGRKWVEALTKTLKDNGIEIDERLTENPYRYAQQLLQNPLNRILEQELDD